MVLGQLPTEENPKCKPKQLCSWWLSWYQF